MRPSAYQRMAALWVVLMAPSVAASEPAPTQTISKSSPRLTSVTAGGDSTFPLFSRDGHAIAFMSTADNLVTNDQNGGWMDVFVRDLRTRTTTLISVAGAGLSGGNGHSLLGGISEDGRFVAFTSEASDLVTNDSNGLSDVFIRDLATGKTILVSVDLAGTRSANGAASNPVISRDGKFVVFESEASNLTANDANNATDVFLRDVQTGVTRLVSADPTGVGPANAVSFGSVITPNARFIAFTSQATNLAPGATNGFNEIYVRDMLDGKTAWISSDRTRFPALEPRRALSSSNPAISEDGRYVAFKTVLTSSTGTLSGDGAVLLRYDLQTGSTVFVSSDAVGVVAGTEDMSGPVISADGRFVAFESKINATGQRVIRVWDAATAATSLASANLSGEVPAAGNSDTPVLSADGSYLAFLSDATDLVTNLVAGTSQAFIRDLTTKTTRLLSGSSLGTALDRRDVRGLSITPDARWAAFESLATDLTNEDRNNATDLFVRDLALDTLSLVSERHPTLPSATANGPSSLSLNAIDAEGRYVLFTSLADNLLPNDTNGLPDIVVHDLVTGSNLMVTASFDGSTTANGASRDPVLSKNGRFVAFVSAAQNLVTNDTNRVDDVFLRDLVAGRTVLVSRSADGNASANGASTSPSLSDDGRFVAFQSAAFNLVSGVTFPRQFPDDAAGRAANDVYLYDAIGGRNSLVSAAITGRQAGNGESINPRLSPDGQFLAFHSAATDLTTDPPAGGFRLFLTELRTRSTSWVVTPSTLAPPIRRPAPAQTFSEESRFLALLHNSTNLYFYDIAKRVQEPISLAVSLPKTTADGSWLAFETLTSTPANKRQITLLHRDSGARTYASLSETRTGRGNDDSFWPSISGDGRYVVFASRASDLVRGDDNGFTDVFLYDRVRDQTTLLSRSRTGDGPGDRTSVKPLISGNGRTVVFQSFASDLGAGDLNSASDIFVVQLSLRDSDQDAIDDDWEMTHFGGLSRDGAGDFDGDGMRDLDEFKAGTNPTADASLFRAMVLRSLTGSETTILWNAVPGRTYVVQYKDSLSQLDWLSLEGAVTATGTTGSKADTSRNARSERFYRVLQID
ncbi:MAG: PD40 domain-containing protein [Verrucomicrobia bacterium]|nr:PD40 domain-containing protein [Verrucomicrobiota bacterium]